MTKEFKKDYIPLILKQLFKAFLKALKIGNMTPNLFHFFKF